VTLFPASQPAKHGWAQVGQAFQRVASLYSNSTPVTFELLAAGVSGDLAYVVGYERGAASVGGGPEGRISTLNPYQGLLTRAASAAVGST
jgi:ketosteroid isomerase-like protein